MGTVGTGVGQNIQLGGGDDAVLIDTYLAPQNLRMPCSGGDEHLLPGKLQSHRAARLQRQQSAEGLQEHLLLGSKCSADARLDHPDLPDGPAHQGGDDPAHMKGHLGGGAHNQPARLVQIGDADMRFCMAGVDIAHPVAVLHHQVGLGEPPPRIAVGHLHLSGDIPLRDGDPVGRWDLVNLGGIGVHGMFHVQHGGQDFILHLDHLQSSLGDLGGLGGHRGHPIPHKPHLIV